MPTNLQPIGTFSTGVFDDGAAEINAFDPTTQRLFVINSNAVTIDILDVSSPDNPTKIGEIDATAFGAGANSIAIKNGLVAVAVENPVSTDPGSVVFFNATETNFAAPTVVASVTVGALPDMVTFTPDGSKVLVANEGEPDGAIDPDGSVSIIDVATFTAQTATFTGFDAATERADGVRIFPGNTVAQDVEPEYISADNTTAYVALQENNAIAVVDIATATITDIIPLGTKDHSQPGNGFDASDRDNGINIQPQPVVGLYMPDAIATYEANGQTYIVTANEGDARSEDDRVGDLTLDPTAFPDAATLQLDENLGRLEVSTIDGDTDGDGDFDQLFAYGSRSFTIFDTSGNVVFDSGDDFEQITAAAFPANFNATNDENDFDSRSDAKGPEPEGVAIGEVDGSVYAFVGLERVGGIMVYDITDPANASFVEYINNRDFSGDAAAGTAGDLGPEGLTFIPAADSPNGQPLLVVSNEVSGTTTVYDVQAAADSTTVLTETFDDSIQFTTSTPFFADTFGDYFGIADGASSDFGGSPVPAGLKSYSGFDGAILAGQDLDGEGASLPITVTWSGLDITSLANLSFSGDFAEAFDAPGDIDELDFIRLQYQIDGGGYQNLLWFSGADFTSTGGPFNGFFKEDTDFDGVGDGEQLGDAAKSFTKAISGTGSTLDLQLLLNVNAGDEDFAVDNFSITGTADGDGGGGNDDASLLISEIMYNPASTEGTWEWVELFNPGSSAVDLSGYVLDDGNSVFQTIANIASGSIGAGETAVLYNADELAAADFEAAWGTGINLIPVTNWGTLQLNNGGDTVALWDSFADYSGDEATFANAIARVDYDDSGDWPADDGAASIYLTDLAADGNNGTNWALSTDGAMTPAGDAYISAAEGGNSGSDIASPGGTLLPPPTAFAINELRISSPSTSDDTSNFVEVFSDPNTSLDGLSLVVLSGEFAPGQIDFAIDLTSASTDSDGIALIANDGTAAATESGDVLLPNLDFFGSPSTFLLVEGFTGTQGADLDADNDGVLDSMPWTAVLDAVSLIDGDGNADFSYSETVFGPSGNFPPAGLARIPNGTGDFQTLEFGDQSLDTPGELNAFPTNDFDLQITEIWPGQAGTDVTEDWFEIVNQGPEAWVSGVDPDLFYDDESADPLAADPIFGLTQIEPGEAAIVVVGSAADADIFRSVWGDVIDLTNVEVGFTDGAGLGQSGDAVNLFVGAPAVDTLVDTEAYPDAEGFSGVSYDVALAAFSVAGQNGAVATNVLGGSEGTEPAVGSPGNGDPVVPVPMVAIYEIQGTSQVSPFVLAEGQSVADFFNTLPADTFNITGDDVKTSGIVTAVDSNGFYLQDAMGDGDSATSDALFVFTSSNPGVTIGDELEVTGTVSEFFPGDTDTRNLPLTQLTSPTITTLSTGNALPEAVILGAGGRVLPSENIDDDAFGAYEPMTDGIDFFESIEAMRVTAQNAVAVSGTNRFGEIFTVVDGGADATGISDRGTLNISPDDFNPEKVQIDEDSGVFDFEFPEVDAGAVLGDVTGVISYSFGNFEILPTEDFTANIVESDLQPDVTTIVGDDDTLTIASYNVLNLDPVVEVQANTNNGEARNVDDDEGNGRFDAIAAQIVNNLNAPDIVGLQEVQDNTGGEIVDDVIAADVTLQKLIDAIVAAGGPQYEFIDNTFITDEASGGQPGGNIRTAYLYDPDRVSVDNNSIQTISGQAEGEAFEGARLPLVATFEFNGQDVTVVNNHFSSKGGSAPILGIEQPFDERQEDVSVNGSLDERQRQSQAVQDFVNGLSADANVVVLGDLNEFEFVSPVQGLEDNTNLTNLTNTLPEDERYSFIFQGNSQSLDHILVSEGLAADAAFDVVHVNSEFAETASRASDHDPLLAGITLEAPVSDDAFWFSTDKVLRVDGDRFSEEDIVEFDGTTFNLFLDGSDVGLLGANINAFDIISDTEVLMSFDRAYDIAGLGTIDDSDIVKFTATSLGEESTGTFERVLDGSSIGLTNGGEDIDALTQLEDGSLLLSTVSNASFSNGLRTRDEDIVLYNPNSGDISLYVDGSDIGLTKGREDIDAVAFRGDELLLSTTGRFEVDGISGFEKDVFSFAPSSIGEDTAGTFGSELFFEADQFGLGSVDLVAIDAVIG